MKCQDRSYIGQNMRPKTIVFTGLDGRLLIAATPWGDPDLLKDFFESIEGFLSTALADADATSPFGVLDCVDSLTNQLRIALLLANERLYRVVNSTEYTFGVETLVLFKQQHQISWARVGGLGMVLVNPTQSKPQKLNTICLSSTLDHEFQSLDPKQNLAPLPIETLGMNSSCNLQFGSFRLKEGDQLLLVSGAELLKPLVCDKDFEFDFQKITQKIIKNQPQSSFWLAQIDPFF